MNKKMIIYLAGPISGLTYKEATGWRDEIEARLNIREFEVFNPMRGKEFLNIEGRILDSVDQELNALTLHKNIYLLDMFRVKKADVLLVNFIDCKKVSIGTVAEIAVAHEHNKLVILIMDKNNIHNHVFVTEKSILVKNMEEVLMVLKNI